MISVGDEKVRLRAQIEEMESELFDALSDRADQDNSVEWRVTFADVFSEQGGFDIVVANPPYISAMEFKRAHSDEERKWLNKSFRTARGAYDLYVIFFERAVQLLHHGGFLSFITPNKYLAAPYAKALREFLRSTCTLRAVVDLSRVPVFANTAVYPVLTFCAKSLDSEREIEVYLPPGGGSADFTPEGYRLLRVERDSLDLLPDNLWGFLLSDGLPCLRKCIVDAMPLGALAQVSATTTAAEADEYGQLLVESVESGYKVINTGTIEPFRSLWGVRRLRDHGVSYLRPCISPGALSTRRRAMYSAPKVIFAKISKACEAVLDERGEYGGLKVNCVYSPTEGLSLEYIVAFAHSAVFNFIYQELFGSLRMGGGYLQFQAPQLRAIPVKVPDKRTHDGVVQLVRKIVQALDNGGSRADAEFQASLSHIDDLIARLYSLSSEEASFISQRGRPYSGDGNA